MLLLPRKELVPVFWLGGGLREMVEATKPRAAPIKGEDGGTITASLVFERPSLARARSFGKDCRPHRIPDPAHASGYRLARIGEVADPVSRFIIHSNR